MIICVIICYGNTFNNPPPPCTFTLTTICKINCCTFMFNMSYSRIALKRNNTVITIKCTGNENYIAPIIKIQNL